MSEVLEYTLPPRVEALVTAAVYARHHAQVIFPWLVRRAILAGALQGVNKLHIKVEVAKRLAIEASEWAKTRPLQTSHRGYVLGAAIATHGGFYWDAYNTKPLADIPGELNGKPKFRVCGEQWCLMQANKAGKVDVELIVLVGVHHDRPTEFPAPCEACLRYFTMLPNHRNIIVVMVHSESGHMIQSTVGELIDRANLSRVECGCCKGGT